MIIKTFIVTSIIGLMVLSACVGMSANTKEQMPIIEVQILDQAGTPLSGITGYVRTVIQNKDGFIETTVGSLKKIGPSSENGQIKLQGELFIKYQTINTEKTKASILAYAVTLRGQEMAPVSIVAPIENFPKSIEMEQGVKVVLKLEGKTVKGRPKVVSAKNTFRALHKSADFVVLKKNGKNVWECILKKGESYVIGWLSKKMFGYQSEPFTASEDLQVIFSPGTPAVFEYDLSNIRQDIQVLPASVSLLAKIIRNGKSTFLSWGGNEIIKKAGVAKIKGLAGGSYQINARPQHYSFEIPFLNDVREVEIKPGKVNRFEPIYPEIDTKIEKGDVSIEGIIYDSEQKPVPDKTVKLIVMDDSGIMFDLYYLPSITDKDGRFKFTGVRPNLSANIKCDSTTGFVSKESLSENARISINLYIGPKRVIQTSVGSPIDDISFRWKDGSSGKLRNFKGKVIVIDFWASWCSPCRRALPKLNDLAKESRWKDDVVFIALSTDHDRTIWKRTVNKYNWNALSQGWFDREKNPFVLNKPIPYYMIIDKNGIIRSAGNDIDVKVELNKIKNE